MGICLVELTKARRAFHLSPNGAEAALHDFKRLLEIVENVRKSKAKSF